RAPACGRAHQHPRRGVPAGDAAGRAAMGRRRAGGPANRTADLEPGGDSGPRPRGLRARCETAPGGGTMTIDTSRRPLRERSWAPALTLVLLSPLVGEVLNGATRLSYIFVYVPEVM